MPPPPSGRNFQFLDLRRLKPGKFHKVMKGIYSFIFIVGDNLSLGDYDFELHPSAVKDYRLLGVVSEVEDLLNKQIMSPVQNRRTALRNGYVVSAQPSQIESSASFSQ